MMPSALARKDGRTDMTKMVAEQMELSRELPVVMGNVDYEQFAWRLGQVDRVLIRCGLEAKHVQAALTAWEQEARAKAEKAGRTYRALSGRSAARWQRMFRQALRCNVARLLTEKEYRRFSRRLAESALLQKFCGIDRLDGVRVPSKSTLDRYDKLFPERDVRELVNELNRQAVEGSVGVERAVSLEASLSDSTCVKASIHFPTDWVLLRDGVRTSMKAIRVIRRHGLKHRMPEPESFLRAMNRLSIAMSQSRRREDGRKWRKAVLRRMKRLAKVVMKHGRRYRRELAETWREQTDLKEGHVRVILGRLDGILAQLPTAIRQAHERIIGGRQVVNAEKILSLYEKDIHVIVRGKADAEVEFGNSLWLTEQLQGLIIDWKLLKESCPGDAKLLRPSQERVHDVFGRHVKSVAGDRGLWSRGNEEWLRGEGIFSALCPRDVELLRKRMKTRRFRDLQRRRAQTEGRVGILKNNFLGRPLRSKGFEHRDMAVAWAVLGHNLWLLSGLAWEEAKAKQKKAA